MSCIGDNLTYLFVYSNGQWVTQLCVVSPCITIQTVESINPKTQELNPSAQRCLPRYLLWILISKGLTARRLYKSFGFKGLIIDVLKEPPPPKGMAALT
jgi:hypothetical protein